MIYNLKHSEVLNKMTLIKSLTGTMYDCFKHIYTYLNEGYKFRECYSCLKMMILAH